MTDEDLFLSAYDINNYDRPSVATDVAVFSLFDESSTSHRKDAEPRLHLLMIKRGEHPFMNCWALPGGFLRGDETVEQCAVRETKEETDLTVTALMPIGIFSQPDRDPRGRILSAAFTSIVDGKSKVMGGSDAINAEWFQVEHKIEGDQIWICLSCGDTRLEATLKQRRTLLAGTELEVLAASGFAFDHAKIIASALLQMRQELDRTDLAFAFLPEAFTLAALQRVYEIIGGETLLTANFRRKTAALVEETDIFTEGAGHRPARLYTRKK